MSIRLVIFSVVQGSLWVYVSHNLLPHGQLEVGESLDMAAKRIFQKFVGNPIQDFYYEQLYTFSFEEKSFSDIFVTYFFLYPEYKISSRDHAKWLPYQSKTYNKTDKRIIEYAVTRLRWKVEYTNVVYSLLPKEFTLSQLQLVYEAVLGKNLDKRNFRKKILSLKLLTSLGKTVQGVKARPAMMYSFYRRSPQMVKIFT